MLTDAESEYLTPGTAQITMPVSNRKLISNWNDIYVTN